MFADESRSSIEKKYASIELLPSEVLRQIFGPELELLTSTRERLNDLYSLSLVCQTFRPIAQASLLSNATIRAEGRATLLRNILLQNPGLARLTSSITWTMFSSTSSPSLLAQLVKITQPTSLAIGHGFFRDSTAEVEELVEALYKLDNLSSFTFGNFDTRGHTSSDFISHHLSQWTNLTRLDLYNVAFVEHLQGGYPLLPNTHWERYTPPTFQLRHLGIHWTRYDKEDHYRLYEMDWISWLLSSSIMSLRSLSLSGLTQALPSTTLDILIDISPHLQNVYISNYTGPQLLADVLLHEATDLYTLTLGGDIAHVETEDGSSVPTLATSAALEGKANLRCLEIHDLLLFDRLCVLELLKAGKLPALRQITLLNASRVYLPVQKLVLWCRGTDISVVVRPP